MAVFHRELGFTYSDPAATSTGLWSIVTDPSKEAIERKRKYPSLPPLLLPGDGIILKEDYGHAAWYFELLLEDQCEMLTIIPTWIDDDPGYRYRRVY